jgi:hypothetical protein
LTALIETKIFVCKDIRDNLAGPGKIQQEMPTFRHRTLIDIRGTENMRFFTEVPQEATD